MNDATAKYMDICEQLSRDLQRAKERLTWRPIATAPKETCEVLLWLTGNRSDQFNDRMVVGRHDVVTGWSIPGTGGLNASHWMPLPETAPSQSAKDCDD